MIEAVRELGSDISAVFRREWLRYRRDRSYWVGQLAFPVLVVVLLGLGLDPVASPSESVRYSARLAAGLLALTVSSGAIGAGYALIEDSRSGFLRALCVAPLRPTGVVLGKIAARGVVSTLLLLALVAFFALFTTVSLAHLWAVALALIALTLIFGALGLALAVWLERAESFRLITALITVPLYFLSGMFYTVHQLPGPLRAVALANPLTYAVDLMRYGVLDASEFPVATSAWALLGLSALCLPAAVYAYGRGLRR